ncbi:MAG: maleylacetoacetate isomerase [Asticcacaulis sp.]
MLTLHGYWRSSAAYRVRIALNLKGLDYAQATYDLRQKAEKSPAYAALNPQQLVPALESDGEVLTQSLAILEWLDETYPLPPLLPENPINRARVRAMCNLIACDIHPLNNLRVLNSLRADFGASDPQVSQWIERWIGEGFAALEQMIDGRFCFGDTPTLADCCLVPQVYNAGRFKVDLSSFPKIRAVAEACAALPAFARAHPDNQPDADRAA